MDSQVNIKSKINSSLSKITFSSGDFLLKGILHLPATDRPPVVIGSHGLLADSRSPKQIDLARHCNAAGIAFFRFDHRGCGKSSGVFHDVTSLEGRCEDLICAIHTMRRRNDLGDKTGLFGSSMGGAVCLATTDSADIDAMVTFAAPVKSRTIINAVEKSKDQNIKELLLYKNNFRFDITGRLTNIRNILVFHGDADNVVPCLHAEIIYEHAKAPKKIIMQSNGDHMMGNKKHQENFIRESVLWFRKYLLFK